MRINERWFEFGLHRSTEMGIKIMEPPVLPFPEPMGNQILVPGRDGEVWQDQDSDKPIDIKIKCCSRLSKLSRIGAWLRGTAGLVVFSKPDHQFTARVSKTIEPAFAVAGIDPIYKFTVTFTCDPHALLIPESIPIRATESGSRFNAEGTIRSRPRVTIRGNGDFTVTIGGQTMGFTDVRDGIIVDTELMDAFTLDGKLLYNHAVVAGYPFYKIEPGPFTVEWEAEEGSNVASVEIRPRWRVL